LYTLVNDIKAKSGGHASYGQGYGDYAKESKKSKKNWLKKS